MKKSLKELAKIVNGEVVGDSSILIKGVASLEEAQEGDITFFVNTKFSHLLENTKASAIIIDFKTPGNGKLLIRTENPYAAFSKIMELWMRNKLPTPGVHPTAVVGGMVRIGKDASIGAYVVIEDGVSIGDGSVIRSHTFVGAKSKIGKNCILHPRVTISERVEIGNGVIIHSGTVIGSDGFGFVEENGTYRKIPHLGTVVIEDNVEIGTNVAIDRATFGKTWIKNGTKIDNLVQIAHNVEIGKNCIIVGQVGISGSVKIGNEVVMAGQAGVREHLTIGDGTKVAARSGVTKSVGPGEFVSGYPARDHREEKRIKALIAHLPSLFKKVQELSRRVGSMNNKEK